MIRNLQINLHRSATAHESLAQFAVEIKKLIQYSLVNSTGTSNRKGRWIPYVYLTPNDTMPKFRRRLDGLENDVLDRKVRILVGVTPILGPLNDHASPRLQKETDFRNGRENRTHSFKHRIQACRLRRKHSRLNLFVIITEVPGERMASSGRLFGNLPSKHCIRSS